MTKDEVIQAMKEGKKVKHKHFSPEEWVIDKDGMFEFEDGCRCMYKEFWQYRDDNTWVEGWTIYS